MIMSLIILFPISFQVAKSQSAVDLTIIDADEDINPSRLPNEWNGAIFSPSQEASADTLFQPQIIPYLTAQDTLF